MFLHTGCVRTDIQYIHVTVCVFIYVPICVCLSGGSVLVCLLHTSTDVACQSLTAILDSMYHCTVWQQLNVCVITVILSVCCHPCECSPPFLWPAADWRPLLTVCSCDSELSVNGWSPTSLPSQSGLRLCSSSPASSSQPPQLLPALTTGRTPEFCQIMEITSKNTSSVYIIIFL